MAIAKEVDLSVSNPKRLREQFVNGLRGRNPEHYMQLLKRMGFIEHLFPQGVTLTWEQPHGIMRSGQARNLASMSLAPFLRDNDPDKLTQLLKKADFPSDVVAEVNFLIRLFDPHLIDMSMILKARKIPKSITTEFDKLLQLKYLLKEVHLPSSLIVRFAQHYQLPPNVPNGPLYIAAMLKYPMKRIKAGFVDINGRPLAGTTTGKIYDPMTFDTDRKRSRDDEGQNLYTVQEPQKDTRIRPGSHEKEGDQVLVAGSPTKFRARYLPDRAEMLQKKTATTNKSTQPPRNQHWTKLPMESCLSLYRRG